MVRQAYRPTVVFRLKAYDQPMNEYAIAAIGVDRPGIVGALTGALSSAGASIEDSSMTILGGQFAMLLLVAAPVSAEELTGIVEPVAQEFSLMLEVQETEGAVQQPDAVEYSISAYGPDQPGLVAKLSHVLASRNVNITDFGSRVGGSGAFAMWFNVRIPTGGDAVALEKALYDAGEALKLEVTVMPIETEAM